MSHCQKNVSGLEPAALTMVVLSDEVRVVAAVDDAGSLISDGFAIWGAGRRQNGAFSAAVAGVSLSAVMTFLRLGDIAVRACATRASLAGTSVRSSCARANRGFVAETLAFSTSKLDPERKSFCESGKPRQRRTLTDLRYAPSDLARGKNRPSRSFLHRPAHCARAKNATVRGKDRS